MSAVMAALIIAIALPASAQTPTEQQRDAIRSACRADYEAKCSSVPPGGEASLQCLQKNMSSLSSSCQQAVSAIEPAKAPAAAPKAESAPAAAPAASAPSAAPAAAAKAPPAKAAAQPTAAQTAAVRNACRNDYEKNCAGVPPGGEASLQCLEKNKAKLSANCQKAVSALGGGTAAPATASAPAAGAATATPAAAAAPAAVLVLRPLRPREELFVMRSACGGDVRTLCGGVAVGGGRIAQCLAGQAASLSPACKSVLTQFVAQ